VAFSLDFDAKHNVLRLTLEGPLTAAGLFEIEQAVAGYAASHPPFRGIVDTAGVTDYQISGETIRELAAAPRPTTSTAGTWVVVTPKEHIYGMTRMFQIASGKSQPNFHVVRTMAEAYALLQIESPEFVLVP
jgi:hypothetical protein